MTTWLTPTYTELNRPLADLVGATTAKPFAPLKIRTVGDLLRHVPRRYLFGTENSDFSELVPGEDVAVIAEVLRVEAKGQEPRRRLEVRLSDGTGMLDVTFFGKGRFVDWWQRQLSTSRRGIFVGKVGSFNGRPQLTHPDFVMIDAVGHVVGKADKEDMVRQVTRSGLVGLYPARAKLPTWTISSTIDFVLDTVGELAEPLPQWVLDEVELPTLNQAVLGVHRAQDRDQAALGKLRLQFDEALALQLTMARRRADNAHHRAPALQGGRSTLGEQFDARLPFTLTAGQVQVSDELFADLASDQPMQRLLQGEVGSGKTLVALRAMLRAVDSGRQAVLLAPTEVLATQHATTIRKLLGDLGGGRVLGAPEDATQVALLTGSMPAPARNQALFDIASGEAGIVIGTHAVLADRVQFADLGLIVVDEQHRFGVEQRAALNAKAELRPHVLVMTATPIPRSVAMTVFGDLEVSQLTEVPAGRSDVQTTVVDISRNPGWVDRGWQRIVEEVAQGRQAFVVCPAISPSQREDTGEEPMVSGGANVTELYAELSTGALSDLRVGMLHGRMSADQKDEVMGQFAAGDLDVLVATTVIEVGVDVPNASVMVIMDADRFGVSQLHQLRGRVGRGQHPGLCLLVTAAEDASPARERLAAVASTRDGFILAEADLAARREGDVLGADQSGGRSTLRLLRVTENADLIAMARTIAERLVAQDPDRADPHLVDIERQTELLAAGDWLERS